MAEGYETRTSDCLRKYTEKGSEWQLEQRIKIICSLLSSWNASAERVNILISSESVCAISVLTNERDKLIVIMDQFRAEGEIYNELLTIDEYSLVVL